MKSKLPALPLVLALLLRGAPLLAQLHSPDPLTPAVQPLAASRGLSAAPDEAAPDQAPPELIERAIVQLAQYPGLEAKLRQRADLMGQQLIGSGSYLQRSYNQQTQVRLELKLQVGDQISSLQQVSDGRFLWVKRDLPHEQSLSRIDLRRVREALEQQQPSGASALAAVLPIGGLPMLLQSLDDSFAFAQPQSSVIRFAAQPASAGGAAYEQVNVWLLVGTWKRERLMKLLPDQRHELAAGRAPQLDQLPPHLPHRVVLMLGRDDQLPLFPYRIQYYREDQSGSAASEGPAARPMLTMELFEVRQRSNIDPAFFEYETGDQALEDHTETYLQKILDF